MRTKREETSKNLVDAEKRVETLKQELASRPSLADVSCLEARLEEERTSRRIYQEEIMNLRGRIRIFCRIRPQDVSTPCLENPAVIRPSRREVFLPALNKLFEYDLVFGPDTSTAGIWEETWPLIDSVFEQPGMSACVMAYGQTGAGKTFTMEGCPQHPGLISLAVDRLFRRAEREEEEERRSAASNGVQREEKGRSSNLIQISLSMLEVYQEQLHDLLVGHDNGPRLTLRNIGGEGGPEVRELRVQPCKSCEETIALYQAGARLRRLGTSERNARSSRSHCVLTLYVQRLDPSGGEVVSTSKISLVDLAGSERQSATTAFDKSRVSEASVINNSLSSLSKVVQACVTRAASPRPDRTVGCHIPYRDSVLTQLLSDSIGGQGKTLVVVHVTQHEEDVQESMRTLQFASNAACVQERPAPRAEEEKLRRQLSRLSTENQRLKDELAAVQTQSAIIGTPKTKRHGSPKSPRPINDRECSPRNTQAVRDESPFRQLLVSSARGNVSPRVASPRASSPFRGVANGTGSPSLPGRKYAHRCPPAAPKHSVPRGGG